MFHRQSLPNLMENIPLVNSDHLPLSPQILPIAT